MRLEPDSRVDHAENPTMNLLGDVFSGMNNSFNESASIPMEDHLKQRTHLMICYQMIMKLFMKGVSRLASYRSCLSCIASNVYLG